MKILTIADKKEEKFLRKKVKPFDFSKFSKKEIRELVRNMRKMMLKASGIGLAANQVGFDFSFFVAQVPQSREGGGNEKFYAIFNPKITRVSSEKESVEEGCLSVPGILGNVPRPSKIILEGEDQNGKKVKIKAWGLLARVFQHEVDHLEGKVFLDRTKEIYRIDQSSIT
ncbi:MAG TPA: peptide deformylase [Candidatus Paceibacterota bacterium]|nr:peptide deformylase [Candidatus Paceibacterota bacterium]